MCNKYLIDHLDEFDFYEITFVFWVASPSLRGNNSNHCNPGTQDGSNCPALCWSAWFSRVKSILECNFHTHTDLLGHITVVHSQATYNVLIGRLTLTAALSGTKRRKRGLLSEKFAHLWPTVLSEKCIVLNVWIIIYRLSLSGKWSEGMISPDEQWIILTAM